MDIIVYRKNTQEMEWYEEDLKYWSNICGGLHHNGEYTITEEKLPNELLRAYHELWEEGNGFLCFLVEFKGKYGVALINQFDEYFATECGFTMDELFEKIRGKAKELSAIPEFSTTSIILGEYSGYDEAHEIIVFLPADAEKSLFNKIANILCENTDKIA